MVGSTLSLTGAFAATGIVHKIAGEEFVDRLNAAGGLLGRPVKWTVLDDQSDQAKVGQLYEQLISQDKVDLIIGPYATPNILSAMAVAARHNYVMPQHTAVLAPQLTYPCQFPAWSIGPTPNQFIPNLLFDALATLPNPPKKIAVLTSQSGSAAFVTDGFGTDKTGVLTIAAQRGLQVVVNQHYAPTISDWGPIAQQVRNAKPDLVISNGLGVDTVNALTAMKQLGYRPPMTFSLFPAPGPLLGLGPDSAGVLSVSIFEPNQPLIDKAGGDAQAIIDDFKARATAAKVPFPVFETQAAASWNAWQILTEGVKGAGKVDQKAICDYLHNSGVNTTFSGHLAFDPKANNFWPTTLGLKQIQDGRWVMVWPADRAAATLQGPAAS
ncbi:MAG TPA: amino acid ABC transporter substrate-binding protein [Candidatus Limnocylindria bacterium]|nr:amino acid ABC transporter substrate-binding protein [Candidatus Limnocylindria bacterium]